MKYYQIGEIILNDLKYNGYLRLDLMISNINNVLKHAMPQDKVFLSLEGKMILSHNKEPLFENIFYIQSDKENHWLNDKYVEDKEYIKKKNKFDYLHQIFDHKSINDYYREMLDSEDIKNQLKRKISPVLIYSHKLRQSKSLIDEEELANCNELKEIFEHVKGLYPIQDVVFSIVDDEGGSLIHFYNITTENNKIYLIREQEIKNNLYKKIVEMHQEYLTLCPDFIF